MTGFAAPQDRAELMEIYDACFPGERDFCEWLFDGFWRAEDTLVLREGGRILSAVHIPAFELALDGERFPATYIYAAGTLPAARGRGCMGRLLELSFEESRRRGHDFSALITQNDGLFAFYGRFGYLPAFAVGRREFGAGELPAGYRLRRAEPRDAEAMLAVYEREMGGRLAPVRSAEWMRLQTELFGETYVLERGAEMLAYCFGERQGELLLTELVGAERELLAAALGPCTAQSPAEGDAAPFGCLLPLSERGERALRGSRRTPYINLMFN